MNNRVTQATVGTQTTQKTYINTVIFTLITCSYLFVMVCYKIYKTQLDKIHYKMKLEYSCLKESSINMTIWIQNDNNTCSNMMVKQNKPTKLDITPAKSEIRCSNMG